MTSRAARVGVVTQARTTSTRLPGKVLRKVAGTTLLEHHLSRLSRAGLTVYVATTVNASDKAIVGLSRDLNVPVYRGSEHDVLSRFADAVREWELDVVVRVTSDCPLIDGDLVASGVRTFLDDGRPGLFVSNTLTRTYPRGMDFEVFWAAALLAADAGATEPSQREHVTPILYAANRADVVVEQLMAETDDSDLRLTVDTPEDLELVTRLLEDFNARNESVAGLVRVLRAHPELTAINSGVEQRGHTHVDPSGPRGN